jgi:hypothetical protein
MVRDGKRLKYSFRLDQDSALIPKRFERSEAIDRFERLEHLEPFRLAGES